MISVDNVIRMTYYRDMENNLFVTLERNGKTVVLILRADDFAQSVRGGKLRWGSGRAWTVVKVQGAGD